MTAATLQHPRFISEAEVGACAEALRRQAALCCEDFAPPYPLASIIWNHLYETDELALDEETPLGIDEESGELIWGKTLAEERLIMIDPSVVGKPYYRFTLAHEIGHWMLHCRPQLKTRERLARRLGGETAERAIRRQSVWTEFGRKYALFVGNFRKCGQQAMHPSST